MPETTLRCSSIPFDSPSDRSDPRGELTPSIDAGVAQSLVAYFENTSDHRASKMLQISSFIYSSQFS